MCFGRKVCPPPLLGRGGLSIIIRPAAGLLADTARSSPAGRPALDWEALVKRGRPRSPSSRRPGVQLKLIGFCPRNLSGARGPSPPAPPEAEAYLVIRPREKSAGDQSLGGWCILILPRQGTLKRFECAFEGFEGTRAKEYSECPRSSNCKGIHREGGQPTPRHHPTASPRM